MDITTSMGLLKFALLGIDLFAWPVLALGYPLFASIRAVETGSKQQMRKLVIYWTLFSLFSLLEFAFAKIIEWIPFWFSIRLVVIFWLVIPQFEGACLAYQALVRPVLLMELQAVIDRFYKLKEDKLCNRETFLDIAEKYIKENGSEALEKLIALEHESLKCIDFQRNTKIIEPEGENTAATSDQVHYEQSISSARVLNGTYAVTNVKEMTLPEASVENRRLEIPPQKETQQEWTCDLCKVTTVGEAMLNAHLRGSNHKSKLDSLKASLLGAKDTGPSLSICYEQSTSSAWLRNGTYVITKVKETTPPEASAENRSPETPPLKKTRQEWTCDLCNLTTMSKSMLNAHLQGSKHKSMLESPKASLLDAKDTGPSPSVQHTQSTAEVREIMPPKETAEKRHPETPLLKKAQKEWTCDLCKVTTTDETTFSDHLHGCTQKSNLETALKVSKLVGSELVAEGPSSSATSKLNRGNVAEKLIKESGSELEKLIASKTGRGECSNSHIDVQVVESEEKNGSAASQQSQSIEVKEMMPPEASHAETLLLKETQQEWMCDLCNVKATSEITLNAHLQGSKHKSKLESRKASLLDAKDTGPSPSQQVLHTQSDAEVKDIMPPNETAEKSPPETPLLKKAQQEWTCDLCKVTTTGETTFSDHLHGCTQKSKLKTALKVSKLAGSELVAEGPSLNRGSVAEKLIKESGSELEKLIASKTGRGECSNSHIDVQVVESVEKNGSEASQHSIEVKEMTPPEASHAETLPLKEIQREWRCDLCNVKATSEITLNAHLQGSKHKLKLESRKASLLDAKDTGPSPSQQVQHTQSDAEVKEIMPPNETAEKSPPETPLLKKAQQEWTCALCKVTATNERTFNDHLRGRKHKSNLESALKASKLAGSELVAEGHSSSATSKLNLGNVAEKLIKESGSELEKLIASKSGRGECCNSQVIDSEEKNSWAALQQSQSIEVKEMTPPEASRAETLPLKETQQEWRCDLCNVKATSEITLNAHLQGSKHKLKLESRKASLLDARDTGPSPSVQHTQSAAEVTEIMPPKETAEKRRPETPHIKKAQQEWTCDLCKVTTTGETTFSDHLHGCTQKSKLETALKVSKLAGSELVAEGPSSSATSKLNPGNVAEKLTKESGSELEKLIASKTGCGECSNSHIDVQVVESEEKNGSVAAQQVQYANAEVKETKPPEANRAKTPPLKIAQQKWSCDLCEAKGTTQKTLIAHLDGRRHKSEFQSLKMSTLPTKYTGLSRAEMCKANESNLVGKVFADGIHWCFICELKLLRDVDAASHFKGKRHSSNVEIMEKVEAMIS